MLALRPLTTTQTPLTKTLFDSPLHGDTTNTTASSKNDHHDWNPFDKPNANNNSTTLIYNPETDSSYASDKKSDVLIVPHIDANEHTTRPHTSKKSIFFCILSFLCVGAAFTASIFHIPPVVLPLDGNSSSFGKKFGLSGGENAQSLGDQALSMGNFALFANSSNSEFHQQYQMERKKEQQKKRDGWCIACSVVGGLLVIGAIIAAVIWAVGCCTEQHTCLEWRNEYYERASITCGDDIFDVRATNTVVYAVDYRGTCCTDL